MEEIDIKKLSDPLSVSDIDFRIQSINNGKYATILVYKDARVDMNRLDQIVGHLNWKREHTKDNHNCIVSIWDNEKKEWVSKEDVGTESSFDKQKGLASDSFKRACFNWGIGRELYGYPVISFRLNDSEVQASSGGKSKFQASFNFNSDFKNWSWYSEFKDGKIVKLTCTDLNGVVRFSFPKSGTKPPQQPKSKPTMTDGRFANFCKLTTDEIEEKKGNYALTKDQLTKLSIVLEERVKKA